MEASMSHSSHNPRPIHLEEPVSLDQIVKQYRPFHKPPPPVPLEESLAAKKLVSRRRQQHRKDQSSQPRKKLRVVIDEANSGDETRSPNLLFDGLDSESRAERSDYAEQQLSQSSEDSESSVSPHLQADKAFPKRLPHQPFLTRMLDRALSQTRRSKKVGACTGIEIGQMAWSTARASPLSFRKPRMLLISVKRQRKLKMKKHKYKKLMRRTRNLRRREGRL